MVSVASRVSANDNNHGRIILLLLVGKKADLRILIVHRG
jgi:hypothetical protein